MAAPTSALIVATAAATFPNSDTPAGCWAEELAAPYNIWTAAGWTVDIATPAGAPISWTPDSMQGNAKTKSVEEFMSNEAACNKTKKPLAVENVDVAKYGVVYIPGGHGAMFDLADDKALQALLTKAWSQGAVVASVCHGPAALLRANDASGTPLLRGRRVACFTNEEERSVGKDGIVPFMLEDAARQAGATVEITTPWTAHVVHDGNLVTGQNPASSAKVAQEVMAALQPGSKE